MALPDVILGDTFLRNTYALYNFGNWTRPGDSGPYIQVLGVGVSSSPRLTVGVVLIMVTCTDDRRVAGMG